MGEPSTKRCRTCEAAKPLTEFHRDSKSPDGVTYACRECACARARKWREENLERASAAQRAFNQTERGRELARERDRRYRESERGREAARARQAKWTAENPERARLNARKTFVKSAYGLTLEEYDEIVARGCAICGRTDGQICVDHDHTSGRVRDALCTNCNLGLGNFQDSPILVEIALAYLKEHGAAEPSQLGPHG
jgi:hypothetical protein